MMTLDQEMEKIMTVVRNFERSHPIVLALKISEEYGEFSETVLKHCGYLEHKEVNESPIHEAADIINVLISTLVLLYPEKFVTDIIDELTQAFKEKGEKYHKILTKK